MQGEGYSAAGNRTDTIVVHGVTTAEKTRALMRFFQMADSFNKRFDWTKSLMNQFPDHFKTHQLLRAC